MGCAARCDGLLPVGMEYRDRLCGGPDSVRTGCGAGLHDATLGRADFLGRARPADVAAPVDRAGLNIIEHNISR